MDSAIYRPCFFVCFYLQISGVAMNIIKLAKRVGYPIQHPEWQKATEEFAALVAAHEREACAKVCAEDSAQAMDFTGGTFVGGYFAKKIMERNKS